MILLNNFIIYIMFGIFLQFSVEVKSQTETFKPDLRMAHTATLINDKLYIIGGTIPPANVISPSETFLYLDVSVPFDTNGLKWIDISSNNIVPSHRSAAAINGGANNNTLFLYGGAEVDEAMALVYTFNTQDNTWSIPKITGVPPARRQASMAIGYNGLIYLFGGATTTTYTNDMFVLDSVNLSWEKASSINAPSPRASCGAVFLPSSKHIIYMGMQYHLKNMNFYKFNLYNNIIICRWL